MSKQPRYIEEIPSFGDLADFREEIKDVLLLVNEFSTSNDIIQRASDLLGSVETLLDSAKKLLLVQKGSK